MSAPDWRLYINKTDDGGYSMIGITKSFSWCAAVPGMRRHGAAPIDFVGGGETRSEASHSPRGRLRGPFDPDT